MSAETLDARIAALFARQYGIISRRQAVSVGATRGVIEAHVRNARWVPVHRGVYRLTGAPWSWRQDLLAACLACRQGAAASNGAACRMWVLPGFGEAGPEISVDGESCRCQGIVVHRVALPVVDVTVVDSIPVTTPARTLIDIAGSAPIEVVEAALDDALRRRLVSRSRLRWRLQALAEKGRRGLGELRTLLDAREDGESVPQSVFETRLFRVLKGAGLPLPQRQYEVRDRGRLVAVPDFAFTDVKLAIEADSYRWHSGRARWHSDLARRNALTALGWRVVHVTWAELTRRPDAVAEAIKKTLTAQP